MIVRIEQPSDTAAAFDTFETTLKRHGFKVQSRSDDFIEGVCGLLSPKKRDQPMRGASPITLTAKNRELELETTLDAVRKTQILLVVFTIVLTILMVLSFLTGFQGRGLNRDTLISIVVFPGILGAGLLYLNIAIGRFARIRTMGAVRKLARSLAESSGGTVSSSEGLWPDESMVSLIRSGAIFVLGSAILLTLLPGGLGQMFDDSNRLVLPQDKTLHLAEPGIYTIFYEYRAKLGGVTHKSPKQWNGIGLTLHAAGSEEPVNVEGVAGRTSYSLPQRAGYAIAQFTAANVGEYTLTAAGIPDGDTRVVSIARFDTSRVLWFAARMVVPILLGLNAFFELIIYVRTRKLRMSEV